MTGSDQPDWSEIRRFYLDGEFAIAAIAERHGVSAQRITRRAQRERWPPRPPRRRTSATSKPRGKSDAKSATPSPSDPAATAPRPKSRPKRPTVATGSTARSFRARRALVRRLYTAIDTKLQQMERRMAHDMATEQGSSDTTAADHERDTRAIGALIANLSRVTEIEAELERIPGTAAVPAAQQGARDAEHQLADEAERFRREVAERLARLVRPS
jgi:type IV secretory pathway VirB10-like protein